MNESNHVKKQWLRRYLEAKKAELKIALELEELESQYILPSKVIDGMPHGSSADDLSTFAARYDELYRVIKGALEKRIAIHREIRQAIEDMDAPEAEKILMTYRYIDGKTFEEIAVRMGYSWRWIMQIHGRALSHFNIPQAEQNKTSDIDYAYAQGYTDAESKYRDIIREREE